MLEPILSFHIVVPEEFGGKIIGEIINMRGTFDSPTIVNGRFTINGLFPLATSMEFPIRLASISSSKGIMSTKFNSYQKCPESVEATMPFRGINPLNPFNVYLMGKKCIGGNLRVKRKLLKINNNYCTMLFEFIRGGLHMKNCEMKLNGNILTITVDISKEFGVSSSGKSIIIGSTEGNISIPEKDDIKIGLNIYRKA